MTRTTPRIVRNPYQRTRRNLCQRTRRNSPDGKPRTPHRGTPRNPNHQPPPRAPGRRAWARLAPGGVLGTGGRLGGSERKPWRLDGPRGFPGTYFSRLDFDFRSPAQVSPPTDPLSIMRGALTPAQPALSENNQEKRNLCCFLDFCEPWAGRDLSLEGTERFLEVLP